MDAQVRELLHLRNRDGALVNKVRDMYAPLAEAGNVEPTVVGFSEVMRAHLHSHRRPLAVLMSEAHSKSLRCAKGIEDIFVHQLLLSRGKRR